MISIRRIRMIMLLFVAMVLGATGMACSGVGEAESAVIGSLESLDLVNNALVVVTPEGARHTFFFTEDTKVNLAAEETQPEASPPRGDNSLIPDVSPKGPPEVSQSEEAANPEGQEKTGGGLMTPSDSLDDTGEATTESEVAALKGKERDPLIVHFREDGMEKTAVAIDHLGPQSLRVVEGEIVAVSEDRREITVLTSMGTEESFDLGNGTVAVSEDGLIEIAELTEKQGEPVKLSYSERANQRLIRFVEVGDSVRQAQWR